MLRQQFFAFCFVTHIVYTPVKAPGVQLLTRQSTAMSSKALQNRGKNNKKHCVEGKEEKSLQCYIGNAKRHFLFCVCDFYVMCLNKLSSVESTMSNSVQNVHIIGYVTRL